MQLMDIALYVASCEIYEKYIKSELTENEASTTDVSIDENGRAKAKFYNQLAKEPWFNVHDVTAMDFLSHEEQVFSITIRARGYWLEYVTPEERQNISDALDRAEKRLLEDYGEHASFEIYFDDQLKAEYIKGQKQER